MKRFALMLLMVLTFAGVYAQEKSDLPNVTIKDVDGKSVNIAELSNDGNPIVMLFWATWCKPCIKEHDAINDLYEEWAEETGVKIYSVSIDDSRSAPRVKPFSEGRGWEYDMLLDVNGDLKRAMNVSNPPHTFVFDGSGKLVYQHSGYADGSEHELFEEIQKAAKK